MKIIHNLLFSIYFWANSLHTMHSAHSHTHIHSQLPPINVEIRITFTVRIRWTPKRFSLLSSGLPAKSDETRTVMLVHHRTHRQIDNKKRSEKMKKAAAAVAAKWNFHFTFIYFSMRVFFSAGCVCRVLFLVSRFALSSSSWRDTLKCWCWFDYTLSILQQTEWFISIFASGKFTSRARNILPEMLTLGLSCFMCFVMDWRFLSTFGRVRVRLSK